MASVTIRNIGEDVKRKLQVRAARNGRSMEQDLRLVLSELVEDKPEPVRSQRDAEAVYRKLQAIVTPPLEPFDVRKARDELWDFVP